MKIGIFDSGIGGASVLRELHSLLPNEDLLFLADQAHVPYGPRPVAELRALFARSTVPVALVTGARDDRFTALAREMVRLRTNVTHVAVPGVGHNVVLEAPDAVAAVMRGA